MHDDENFKFYGKKGIIELTIKENIILKKLIKNKGKIVTLKQLCELCYWDNLDACYENSIIQSISRIRKKLKGEVYIENIAKKGYRIS